jgi:hypothetical protein
MRVCGAQAVSELLADPAFTFRDALLQHLWQLDTAAAESYSNNSAAAAGSSTTVATAAEPCSLVFAELLQHPGLRAAAVACLQHTTTAGTATAAGATTATSTAAQGSAVLSLLRAAVKCLREDRLLYLSSERDDRYLVASQERFLKPLVRSIAESSGLALSCEGSLVRSVQRLHPWVTTSRVQACLAALRRSASSAGSSTAGGGSAAAAAGSSSSSSRST